MVVDGNSAGWFCTLPGLAVLGFVAIAFIYGKNEAKKDQIKDAEENDLFRTALEKYNKAKSYTNIPNDAKVVELTKEGTVFGLFKGEAYLWKTDEKLCFFPHSPKKTNKELFLSKPISIHSIEIDKIEYFKVKGEVYKETKITGGGGGGSSIKGAVVGQAIAGGVGAVVGSRKKIDEVKSQLITHDERLTLLNYFDEKKERRSLIFKYPDYHKFNDLIPEKEFHIVKSIKSAQLISSQKTTNNDKNITEQIRELAKLRDEGILTDEEFNEKKKVLLDKIK